MILLRPFCPHYEYRSLLTPVMPLPEVHTLVDPPPYYPRQRIRKSLQQGQNNQTPDGFLTARLSKLGYFKAIKRAKASYWADFFAKTCPNNISTAKKLGAPRKTPRFPSLPDASDLVLINKALLNHFFPPKDSVPDRSCLTKNPSAVPLSENEVRPALSTSYTTSAPGPDGVHYYGSQKGNLINPTIIQELLSPLVAFDYDTPSLKTANRVVLDKSGKASSDSPPPSAS